MLAYSIVDIDHICAGKTMRTIINYKHEQEKNALRTTNVQYKTKQQLCITFHNNDCQ